MCMCMFEKQSVDRVEKAEEKKVGRYRTYRINTCAGTSRGVCEHLCDRQNSGH